GGRCAGPVTGPTTAGASSGGSRTRSASDSSSGAESGERVLVRAPVSSVRETAMTQGRRHVQTYIGVTDYGRLQGEAAARNATISKCAADCLREYFALRAELATALETAGEPGDPHHGAIIH